MIIGMIFGLIIGLAFYGLGCYITCRLLQKFVPSTELKECLIPFWNMYLVLRVAVTNPVPYFWYIVLPSLVLGFLGGLLDLSALRSLGSLIGAILWARAMGLIAEKLGKNFWAFAVLTVIPVGNFVGLCILAFDDSKPLER
ncbi:MAG: hypothetical protein H6Q73_2956 [Firmicutes bacterium]|nr:hypothetical protein [Bacillota bacterium]